MGWQASIGTKIGSDQVEVAGSKLETFARGARGLLFCHGADTITNEISDPTVGAQLRDACGGACATGRYVLINSQQGGVHTWGNDTSLTAVSAAKTALQATTGWPRGGASTPKFAFVVVSMGNITALNWLRANGLTNCAGVVACSPACDLSFNRGTDVAHGEFYANVNSAYSIATDTDYNTIKATRDPELFAAGALNGLKWTAFTRSDDTTEPPSYATTLATTIGATATVTNVGTGGHGWCIDAPTLISALDALPWGGQ